MRGLVGTAIGQPAPAFHLRRPLLSTHRSRTSQTCKALALPPQFGYVTCTVAISAAIAQWMASRVAFARRAAGVKYPKMYADGDDEVAMVFNCTQRAHQNTLESLAPTIVLAVLVGLQSPLLAAGLGMAWNVGRIVFALGYSKGDPAKRRPGAIISGLAYVGLILAASYFGVRTLLGA